MHRIQMMPKMLMSASSNFSYQNNDMMILPSSNQQHMFDPMLCTKSEETMNLKKQRRTRRRKSTKNMNNENDSALQGKRKLTDNQAAQMELYFEQEPKLETERKEMIAAELGLEPRQVAVWFQNRRARWKCKKLEDEFANLRESHHCVLAQKAQLEAQVSELSGRLVEAKGEILRLSERYENGTTSNGNTPTPSSSSMSMSMDHAHTNAEFVSEGFGMQDAQLLDNEYVQAMDYYWMNNFYDLM